MNEHHSRAQPRNPMGQFVTADSFDGRLAAFQKVLVDLDGDGKPDAVAPLQPPANAMAGMRGPSGGNAMRQMAYGDMTEQPRMQFPPVPPVGAPASPELSPWDMMMQENRDDAKRPYVPMPPPSDKQPRRINPRA